MATVTTAVLVGLFCLFCGFVVGYLFKNWLFHRSSSGVIYVAKEDDRTLYSLELSDYPESLQFKKEVLFRVAASGETREEK